MQNLCRSKWFVPLFAVALGVGFAGAQWAGGHPWLGAEALGIMGAFAALLLVGGRSETVRGLRGDGRDERFRQIDLEATALAGVAVIVAVIVAFGVDVARGGDGMPYAWLGGVAGIAYLAGVAVLRVRR
jgi:hypothetical protein